VVVGTVPTPAAPELVLRSVAWESDPGCSSAAGIAGTGGKLMIDVGLILLSLLDF
jgi:hypothetical protein